MTKTAAKPASRKTRFVPVTTMDEVPVLSEAERAELLASLKEAQAEIAAGDFDAVTAESLGAEFEAIYDHNKSDAELDCGAGGCRRSAAAIAKYAGSNPAVAASPRRHPNFFPLSSRQGG